MARRVYRVEGLRVQGLLVIPFTYTLVVVTP